jgi:tellurite resistance protein
MSSSTEQVTPTAYVEPEPDGGPRLAHFPVTFFAVVMGVAGLSLAWTRAAHVLDVSAVPGNLLFWLALAAYLLVFGAYVTKAVRHPDAVRE